VHHRGRSYGVIMVTFMEPHAFPLIERVTLTAFAHQMGIAMDNGRLHRQERQRIAFLSAQADLAEALSTTLQRRDVVRILGETIRATAPSRAVAVWLQQGRDLTLAFQSGFQEDGACRPVLAPGDSRIMAALSGDLLSQIPLAPVVADLDLDPERLPRDARAFAMPLLCGGGLEGLLVFLAPGAVDPAMVRDMGDRSALALHNARLYEDSLAEASLDPLTGLSNRRAFLNGARPCVAGAARTAAPLSVLMLDADHFKMCNDTYGHGVGDKVLVLLAGIVRAQVRPSDLVGRLGGEEFAVVLKDANQDAAYMVAERIRLAMAASRLDLGEGRVIAVPTVSLGLAELDGGPGTDLERLLERADAALYQAKDGGRNRTCRWLPS